MDKIQDVRFVEMKESRFVKPFRMFYKQDGKEKAWDCVKAHDSVAILIYNKTRDVFVFVEQFRPAVYVDRMCREKSLTAESGDSWSENDGKLGLTLELCAGIMDKNMSPEDTAVAEVLEECGYKISSDKLEKITSFLASVGTSGGQMTLFFAAVTDAMKVNEGGGLESEGEMINVKEMSVDEVRKYMKSPSINSPSGFMYALLWFFSEKVV